ncbi:nitroreductase [Pseudomonas gingeri]|uniref:Nitroreductase n=1 Tax=Pseudomonas gingeri TaxID=117681 RepID=A0A7Y8CLL9_9PSED|nr:nitroreductase [Pseudomonas gingeri]NWB27928.1 nitroreductase [Pseudomonas gingeri]NWC35452.1 nitroreductase [Pseudomonas gingeri]NWD04554.1 nitroreductase [Pseudomonas gingeri]NWD51410.1 nitroreductase [Pseudomonas gingeri]NWE31080.1 nitroreductase [Pseudomonas gingeri]
MSEISVFEHVVRTRRVTRQFLPDPVALADIEAVLRDARQAPSNCNTQPWLVHIVSGRKREELAAALLAAERQEQFSPDFFFDMAAFPGVYAERAQASGKAHYETRQVAWDDKAGRREATSRNLDFFGAPHVALLFMPVIGDSVRTAGDLGMYGQTFLLSLAARGLAGVPQTYVAMFAQTLRSVLRISDDFKLLFGISFGYGDPTAVVNGLDVGRADLSQNVVFHQ